MNTNITLPLAAVRLMQLNVQGLLHPPDEPAAKESVLAVIRRMGVLQIDTINVVARSPYLVLFSRLGDYNPAWLDEHLAEGALFEYWAHAACLLPIEDYALLHHRMETLGHSFYNDEWLERHATTIEHILTLIREQGPVRSSDFERSDGQKGSWWNWKAEKQVLEFLHTSGSLMIARRDKFQRIYDLRERVLPDWDAARSVPTETARDILTERSVRLLGATPASWASDYYRLPKQGMPARLKRLADEERLIPINITGSDEPWYLHPENLSLAELASAGEMKPTLTTLLSPFDPLVWDRFRARTLFGFDYSIECYTPEPKRRYGYFSLPILHQGQLVGRLDAKAHRKDGRFEVKAIHLEPQVIPNAELAASVAAALQRCANWHQTPQVDLVKSTPAIFLEILRAAS
jgi:hypothetical protein